MRSGSRGWVTPDLAVAVVLAVAGTALNLRYARMGVMPLDHSIVFDGGWRLLDGQVPWRDFVAPFGIVPAAMQAVVFGVFGVTWSAFAWHASVVNGLFAALTFGLLVSLGLPRVLAAVYAAASAVFFYPPIGAPFADQHSFFFSLAMIAAAVTGNRSRSPTSAIVWWALTPPAAALAFLSKPVPLAFAATALPLLMLVPGRADRLSRITGLVLGAAAVAVAGVALVGAFGIDLALFGEYAWRRPRLIGDARAAAIGSPLEHLATRYVQLPVLLGLAFAPAALAWWAASVATLAPLAWWSRRDRGGERWQHVERLATATALAAVTYSTSLLFSFVSNNQKENALALLPVAAGLVHAAMVAAIRATAPGAARWIILVVSILPIWHWVHDVRLFTARVNETRTVNDLTFDALAADRAAVELPDGLAGLRWSTPARFDGDGWRSLMRALEGRREPMLVFSDMLMTYGLLGQTSIAPSLWFHPGLTMPDAGTAEAATYEAALIGRAEAVGVRIVVVDDGAWFGQIGDLMPGIQRWLAASWCETSTFGAHHVYEPCR